MLTKDRIFHVRSLMNISRSEFAKRIGCDYRSIYFWEKGLRHPSVARCRKIAELAAAAGLQDVGLDWLRPIE